MVLTVALGRDHWIHISGQCGGHNLIAVVALIRQQVFRRNSFDQWDRLGAICRGSLCDDHPHRHAMGVHRQMQLGIQPPLVRAMS